MSSEYESGTWRTGQLLPLQWPRSSRGRNQEQGQDSIHEPSVSSHWPGQRPTRFAHENVNVGLGSYSSGMLYPIHEAQTQQQQLETQAQQAVSRFHQAQLQLSQHFADQQGGVGDPNYTEQHRLGNNSHGALRRTNAVRRSRGVPGTKRFFRAAVSPVSAGDEKTSVENHGAMERNSPPPAVEEAAKWAWSILSDFGREVANVAPRPKFKIDQLSKGNTQSLLKSSNNAPKQMIEPRLALCRSRSKCTGSVKSAEEIPISTARLRQMTNAMGAVCVNIHHTNSKTLPWTSTNLEFKQNGTKEDSQSLERPTAPASSKNSSDDVVIQRPQAVYTGSSRMSKISTASYKEAQTGPEDHDGDCVTSSTSVNASDDDTTLLRPENAPLSRLSLSVDARVARLLAQAKKPLRPVQVSPLGSLDGFRLLNNPHMDCPPQRLPPPPESVMREAEVPDATSLSASLDGSVFRALWPQISGPLNPEAGTRLVVRNPDRRRQGSRDDDAQSASDASSSNSTIDPFGREWEPLPQKLSQDDS